MLTSSPSYRRVSDHRYFLWAGVTCAAVMAAGFAQSYFLRRFFVSEALPWLLHAHGLLMTLWFVVFFVQTQLIAVHRVDLHRRVGWLSCGLAALMVAVTATVFIKAARRQLDPFPDTVTWQGFLLVQIVVIASFAAFFAAAVLLRKKPDVHKRLMLLATFSIIPAAVTRVPLNFIEQGSLWTANNTSDALMLICIAVDVIRNRRLHPVFLWGGLLVVVSHSLSILVGNTVTWARVAAVVVR